MPQPTPDLWLLLASGAALLGLAWLSRGAVRLPKPTSRSDHAGHQTDRPAADARPRRAADDNKQSVRTRENEPGDAMPPHVNLSA